MSDAIQNLQQALKEGAEIRPAVGGFPYLAATLHAAGVRRNLWYLPAMESVYLTDLGPVVVQGEPLLSGPAAIAPFDRDAVAAAILTDLAGESTFPEFIASIWAAGVWHYEVDLDARTCTYVGHDGSRHLESYDSVTPRATGTAA